MCGRASATEECQHQAEGSDQPGQIPTGHLQAL